jgi:4-alpha-glucanotransferase
MTPRDHASPLDPVVHSYVDAFGVPRTVSPEAVAAVRRAMGIDAGPAEVPGPDPVRVARAGDTVDPPADLVLEDGTAMGVVGRLPRDLPHGYQRLVRARSEQLLLVGPRRCHLPPDHRAWAWALQLYATRSRRSWGIGDLADLRTVAAWSREVGAEALVVNPIGAPNPAPDPEPSPYYPSSRRFRDPLMLAIDEVPGADGLGDALSGLTARARALNDERIIDRRRVQALKLDALERIWASPAVRHGPAARQFEAYRADGGDALHGWATFAMLSERLGAGWRSWPEPYRDAASAAVARAARDHAERVAFHAWVQFALDEQLRSAAVVTRLISDLPVGFDPGGFDAWAWQRELAEDASIGAPPDRFNVTGQDWGLPPFIPHRLRASGHRPFVETIRSAMRYAGGLRIDHVLGLFRQWWVPAQTDPGGGAYVRYPSDELLAILAIESERSGAIVIGEDLGTVEAGVRQALAARSILSTRLLYFERRPPSRYPRLSLAAVTTHDLPTMAGLWTGIDLGDQRAAGLRPDPRGLALLRSRVCRAAGLGPDADLRPAVLAAHAALARSPSALVSASLDDALGVRERPNMPGTVNDQRPNWSIALPRPLEELARDPFVRQLARRMSRGRGEGSRSPVAEE